MNRQNVLFLCTGNSARSQMAEAFLRKYASDSFEVYSAGLDPQGINPLTRQVMSEAGVSLEDHWSKSIDDLEQRNFSFIITVCGHAEDHCPRVFLSAAEKHLFWHFEDPAAAQGTEVQKLEKFRLIRDQIEEKIRSWIQDEHA